MKIIDEKINWIKEELPDLYEDLPTEDIIRIIEYVEIEADNKALHIINVVKHTLGQKEAAYSSVITWYEKEYDSSTPDDEVVSMDKKGAELNAQIILLKHILYEVGEL